MKMPMTLNSRRRDLIPVFLTGVRLSIKHLFRKMGMLPILILCPLPPLLPALLFLLVRLPLNLLLLLFLHLPLLLLHLNLLLLLNRSLLVLFLLLLYPIILLYQIHLSILLLLNLVKVNLPFSTPPM